jgi:hypothetical protein
MAKNDGTLKPPYILTIIWPLFIPLKVISMTNNPKITEYMDFLGLNYFIKFIIGLS